MHGVHTETCGCTQLFPCHLNMAMNYAKDTVSYVVTQYDHWV